MSTTTDTMKKIPTRREARAARGVIERAPSVAIAMRANDSNEPKWNQVAIVGSFRGHAAGAFEMNAQTFEDIIRNFKSSGTKRVPLDYEHASEAHPASGTIPTNGAPACGWIVDLAIRDNSLWGLFEFDDTARRYIRSGAYRFLSPAIVFGSKDRVTGKPIGARLSSVALTNSPFLDRLAPVTATDRSEREQRCVVCADDAIPIQFQDDQSLSI